MKGREVKLLVIEDCSKEFDCLNRMFKNIAEFDIDFRRVEDIHSAITELQRDKYDLVVVDFNCNQLIEPVDILKLRELYHHLPIVIITNQDLLSWISRDVLNEVQESIIRDNISAPLVSQAIQHAVGRRRIERRLRQSELRFRNVIENIVDAVIVIDREGTLKFVNPAAEKLFDKRKDQLVGAPFGFPSVLDDSIEIEILRTNGGVVTAEMRSAQIDWDGEQVCLASLRDITDRKQIEKALRASELRLAQIIQGSSLPSFVINRDHVVTHWNKACENLTGKMASEIIGTRDHWLAFYSDPRPTMADLILDGKNAIEIARHYDGKVKLSSHIEGAFELEQNFHDMGNRSRWIYITAAPLRDRDGRISGVIETLQDITSRKKTEEALKRSTRELSNTVRQLEKANQKILQQQKSVLEEERLKVILHIVGATAHEINQPLSALLGNIELLREDYKNPEKLLEYLGQIEIAGLKINEILKRFQVIHQEDITPSKGESMSININQNLSILSIEDNDQDYKWIQDLVRDENKIKLDRARNLRQAQLHLHKRKYDLLFLDFTLPDGNGLDFITWMNQVGDTTPVIVITGKGNEMIATQIIQRGAYDYLPKSTVSKNTILRSIVSTLEKSRIKNELRQTQKKLVEMSIKDELTGLYNRRYMMESLERELARANRYNTDLVICMLDIDHFKEINDTYGHIAGDRILVEMGQLLSETFRQSDLACRYGGEEFSLILPNTDIDQALISCDRFRELVAKRRFNFDNQIVRMTISIGLASFLESEAKSSAELIARADQALYKAKNNGRNRVIANRSTDLSRA